jgi:uncharacterized protein YdeI (YjbR/CyaY-like superfamily)
VPDDLTAALAADDRARIAFEAPGRSERYAIFLPLLRARTPEARARALGRALDSLVPPVPSAGVTGEDSVGAADTWS